MLNSKLHTYCINLIYCRYTVIFRIYDWHKYILICQIIFVPWFAILPPQVTQYPNFESRVDFTRPLCFPILSRHPEDEVFDKPERFNLTNEMQCLRGFGDITCGFGDITCGFGDITCGLGEIWGNSTAWLRHFAAKRDQTSTIARRSWVWVGSTPLSRMPVANTPWQN